MKPFSTTLRFTFPAACALLLTLSSLPLHATGDDWIPPAYLEGTGKRLQAAPEFFWELEIQRLSAKYRDKDSANLKRKTSRGVKREDFGNDEAVKAAEAATGEADKADFEDALKSGRLKPADPNAARNAHLAARAAIDGNKPLPDGEADSEFADYHAGAAAPVAEEAAATAWKKLLARPKEERHYRSVWAAFMLGKRALKNEQWEEAVKRFEECRTLVREGFADSLGLAADSYGWQGRAELMAEHYPQAARLYLTQLSLGDDSAVVSLKRMIPEWTSPMSGGLPGEPLQQESPEKKEGDKPDDEKKAAEEIAKAEAKAAERWLAAARDPALQELVTAHVLATNTGIYTPEDGRNRKWLEVIDKAGVKKVEDATALAWVAYTAGDYKAASAWVAKEKGDPPLARWLKAKFALRGGKFTEAAKLMDGVEDGIPAPSKFNSPAPSPPELAHGETGALYFANGQYPEALDEFRKGNCMDDLVFMMESIMTTDELIEYASKKVPAPPKKAEKPVKEGDEAEEDAQSRDSGRQDDHTEYIRSLIGRRLVRDGRVKESRSYLSEYAQKKMDEYIALAVKAEDKKVSAADRAKAWWEAGVMMKEDGHAFRGTQEDPHFPSSSSDEGDYTVRTERLTGTFTSREGDEEQPEGKKSKPKKLAVFIPAREEEKKRLAATAKHHVKAMRTRVVGANHLVAAAALLPNGSEQKARMLNTAGYWLQDIDNPAADKIFNQLEKTCGETKVGKAAKKRKWFIGETDPYTAEIPEQE